MYWEEEWLERLVSKMLNDYDVDFSYYSLYAAPEKRQRVPSAYNRFIKYFRRSLQSIYNLMLQNAMLMSSEVIIYILIFMQGGDTKDKVYESRH